MQKNAKTSVGASTLIVVLVWIMSRIHFVRASEASQIPITHNLVSVKKTCEASF